MYQYSWHIQTYAVSMLAKEGYGYLSGNSQPFYKKLNVIRGLPENLMRYESGYTVNDVSSKQAGKSSI